jgi:hypothetical protein
MKQTKSRSHTFKAINCDIIHTLLKNIQILPTKLLVLIANRNIKILY